MKNSFFATIKNASASTVSAVTNKVSRNNGIEGVETVNTVQREEIRKLLVVILAQQDLVMEKGFMKALELKMAAQGVSLVDVSTITSAIMSDPAAFADVYRAHTRMIPQVPEALAGLLHDGLIDSIKSLGNYTDPFIWIALQVYGGNSIEHCQYTVMFANHFDNNQKEVGSYIRDYIQEEKKMNARGMAYYTADAIRITGNLMQDAVVVTAMMTNKFAFQLPAQAIDHAASRPEELTGLNLISNGMNHPLRPSVADTTMNLVIAADKREGDHHSKLTKMQAKALGKQLKREEQEEKKANKAVTTPAS